MTLELHIAGQCRDGAPRLDRRDRPAVEALPEGSKIVVHMVHDFDCGGWPCGPSTPEIWTREEVLKHLF